MALSTYDMECLQKAKTLIEKDLSRHFTISEIAAVSGIGTTKLKQGFKKQFGHPIFVYLRRQRMQYAASLLTDTNKTIKQIAKAVGFLYTSNFTTAFTSFHHISPALYRKTIDKK